MQTQITTLPPLTSDLSQIKQDLAQCGVALLRDALCPAQLSALTDRLTDQAVTERQLGNAFLEDGNMNCREEGPNQRVFGLIGKGAQFRSLALNQSVLEVIRGLFGDSYGVPAEFVKQAELDEVLLSSMTANIVGPGSTAMNQHADQAYMPPTTAYAGVINIIWLLTDFTTDNGATLIAPGSHLADEPLRHFISPPQCCSLVAPAGTAVFLDGRTWHGTGANRTEKDRTAIFSYYCRPFMRQQENYARTVSPELLEDMDEELKRLLGYQVWFTLGGVPGDTEDAPTPPNR